ncbi:MAG TPA: ABC transporter substrate-binding protein [Stellaceae bacterium]|nr:ABC transporter substrate-binding protein [Stellaceae bacterium]
MSRVTAFAAAFALALLALAQTGSAAEAVVLQLSGPATFEFAGYYAALWQGYYRAAGLDVTIRPSGVRGQPSIDAVREVAEGHAQFGTGSMQLVIRRAQGLPILLVAPIFQESGTAVYYRADSDFSSPATLVNARLGRLAASDILDIELATALRAEGIDPARTKSVTINADQIVPSLADHAIDAAVGSAWTVPWQAHERGLVLKSFNPANYRVEYYGDSLFTMQHYETAEPDVVRRFREATLKGWEYALRHPDDMINRLVADKPGEPPLADTAGLDRYQADVARRLSRYPEIPLGYSNADRWTQIEAGMVGAGVLERSADLTSFVYSPANPAPRASGYRKLIGLASATVLAAIVLALATWYAPPVARTLGRRLLQRRVAVEPEAFALSAGRTRAKPAPERPPPPPPPLPPPTDLSDVLAPLERRIRQRVRGKVRCRFSLIDGLWPCRTQGGMVAATVLDLVDEANAAMDAAGTLIVGTRNFTFDEDNIVDFPGGRLGSYARITVRDSGPGLTDDEFGLVLDVGHTSRPAVTRAAAVMERLGGFVRVESAEGVGTAVHLYFARVGDDEEETMPTSLVAE